MNRILVVNLARDIGRRDRLREDFPYSFPRFEFVEAVDGKALAAADYFSHIKGYFRQYSGVLTPSEVGCALSHMKCLDLARQMNKPVLILEDDVLGNDEALSKAIDAMATMSDTEVMFMGGMQDLPSWERVFGTPCVRDQNLNIYEVNPASYKYIWRTCCYAVTPRAAELLLQQQRAVLHRADDWRFFFSHLSIKVTLIPLLAHPPVGLNSNLAHERDGMDRYKKIWRIAVERLSFNLSHRLFPLQVKLMRLRKIE